MSDFEVFYRGVRVPDDIVYLSEGDQATARYFRLGVDLALGSPESQFIGRVFLDEDGDEWHEQSPDMFDMRWSRRPGEWVWSTEYAGSSEEQMRETITVHLQNDRVALHRS